MLNLEKIIDTRNTIASTKDSELVHIVYPNLNTEDGNWELRTSIRSLYAQAVFKFDITIIGDIPDWINRDNVRCIEFNNHYLRAQRQSKINQKILYATRLYDSFLVMNDDIILLKPITFGEISVPRRMPSILMYDERQNFSTNSFVNQMRNTLFKLRDLGLPYRKNFVTHTPHYYNSKLLLLLNSMIKLDPLEPVSIVIENAYHNFVNGYSEPVNGFRFGIWGKYEGVYNNEPIFNFNENGVKHHPWIRELCDKIYPEKCKAEK